MLFMENREKQGDLVSYDIWGITALELEVDVLTGDYKVRFILSSEPFVFSA